MNRNKLRVVGVLLFAAAFGAQMLLKDRRSSSGAASASTPNRITLGTLTFTPCQLGQDNSGATTDAMCAPFQVPEDWDHPEGRKLDLKVALIPSDSATVKPDLVTYLAGGPGESSTATWPMVAPSLDEVRKHHHVLLVDQRGTGASHPLTCKAKKEMLDDDSAAPFSPERVKQRTKECLDQLSPTTDVRFYTTEIAVRDLEAVREALGSPKLDLIGVSYGTRLAQHFAMRHPEGVRSLLLDGVVPNSLVLGSEFAKNLEAALKARFALCEANAACSKAFGNPYKDLYALRDALAAKPQKVTYRDPATFERKDQTLDASGLAMLVRMFAYSTETAALIPITVQQAQQGNYGPLMGQIELLEGDLSGFSANALQASIICTEDVDALAPNPADEHSLLGNDLVNVMRAQCEVWPKGTRPQDFRAPLKSDIPTLLTSGELDPVTPPRYGDEVLAGLSHARHLIAKGQGHSVIGRGCMPKLVAKFEDSLDPKGLDASCLDVLQATPTFIDLNGAQP